MQAVTVGVIGDVERAQAEFAAHYRSGPPIVVVKNEPIVFRMEDAWATGPPQPGAR